MFTRGRRGPRSVYCETESKRGVASSFGRADLCIEQNLQGLQPKVRSTFGRCAKKEERHASSGRNVISSPHLDRAPTPFANHQHPPVGLQEVRDDLREMLVRPNRLLLFHRGITKKFHRLSSLWILAINQHQPEAGKRTTGQDEGMV